MPNPIDSRGVSTAFGESLMAVAAGIQRAVDGIANLPGLRQMRRRRFDEAFAAGQRVGCCRGLYETAAEAAKHAPPTRPLGYDNDAAAEMYRDRLSRVYPSDYPMMVWLENAFADGAR